MFSVMIPSTARRNGHLPSLLSDGFFSDFFRSDLAPARWATWPAVDVREHKDKFVLIADLPGVEEKDIKVEFNDGALVVEGVRASHEESEDCVTHIQERTLTQFKRTFALGDGVSADKIQANYKNGTLTIEIPKAERAIPRPIPITVGNKH
jgi:HSP20 family protein